MYLGHAIKCKVGERQVTLVPRLRHAMRLEREIGLPKLINGLRESSLTTIIDILSDHTSPVLVRQVFDNLDHLTQPCLEYVLACYGIDPTKQPENDPKAKKVAWSDHFDDLYSKATGWLGWPPEIALNASPIEIISALRGREELLRALFGSSEPKQEDMSLSDKIKAAFLGGKLKVIKGKHR